MVDSCLSHEDHKAIIRSSAGSDDKLLSAKLEGLGGNIRGFLGSHRILKLELETAEGTKSSDFFVKTLIGCSFDDEDIFKKEVFAYEFMTEVKTLIPEVDTDIMPKMYHHANRTIVLENLGAKGYVGLNSLHFDKAHMLQALVSLAKFHAISLVYEAAKGADYRMLDDFKEILKPRYCKDEDMPGHRYIKSCWIGASTLVDLSFKDDPRRNFLKNKIDEAMAALLDLLNEENGFRKVFSHGDIWGNNCLFKYNKVGAPIHCSLVDFQLNRYTPPAHDVTMLIYMASDRRTFHTNVNEYFRFYYDSLRLELKKHSLDISTILPEQEFEDSCKICMPLAKYTWLCYQETIQAGDEMNQRISDDAAFSQSVVFGYGRAEFVTQLYSSKPEYRKFLDGILEDFRLTHISKNISLEDCCEIISNKLGTPFEILDYSMDRMDLKSGYLGDHYELKITVVSEGAVTNCDFFAKLSPEGKEYKKEFLSKSGADFKEMRFFSKIIPDLNRKGICTDFTPRCYLAKPGILVLDNLKPKNYTLTSIRVPLNFEQVKLGLDPIAQLHASGFLLEEQLGKSVRLNAIYPQELKEALYIKDPTSSDWVRAAKLGAKTQARMYSNHTSSISLDEFLDFLENIFNNYPGLVEPSKKRRNTICHGDLWTNNMMFAEDCKLVDFQFFRYSPPARDFMQFIYVSTDREFRSHYLADCKEHYYKRLEGHLKGKEVNVADILSYPEFLESCEEEKAFVLSQTLVYYQHLLTTPERAQEKLFDDAEYFQEAFLNDRSEFVRSTAELDPVYSRRNNEAVKDLREYCEGIFGTKCELPLGFDQKYVPFICNNFH